MNNKEQEKPQLVDIDQIDFDKQGGLIPAIIQDAETLSMLMLGYMNRAALEKTLQTGTVCFWSRSRQELWVKGETSGNTLKVDRIYLDCDLDTILVTAFLIGTAVCHTGNYSCFFTEIRTSADVESEVQYEQD
jgi:phosphoribosyl-AMP cyclohydrolase